MNIKKKIGIVGFGFVGKLVNGFFKDKCDVIIYDPLYILSCKKEDINACDVAYVCVPTQPTDDGSCDTSIVDEVIDWINTPIIVIKSTVEPGTTKRLKEKTGKNIVFSPEYAGESSYWSPYKFHTELKELPFYIFGGDKNTCHELINLYQTIAGPTKTYRVVDSTSAEFTKYMTNCFFATKIAFCNEMFDLINKSGCNYNEIRELWILDPRLNPMHTLVFPNNRGFGGKCFPKDTKALHSFSKKMGSELTILDSVIKSNDRIRNNQ